MGCDGGTIPKRHELVRTKQRPEQKDKEMERSAKWSCCSISQQELVPPIVGCELGKLYSKESVLEFLLDRSISDAASHVRTLKDIKELNLTANGAFDKQKRHVAGQYDDMLAAPYICPVSGLEMNGHYKFCFLWSCGCVLSDRAIKEVPAKVCHKCGKSFAQDDIIILNPEEDADKDMLTLNMQNRRGRFKKVKQEAKRKRKSEHAIASDNLVEIPFTDDVKEKSSLGAVDGTFSKKGKLSNDAQVSKPSVKKGDRQPKATRTGRASVRDPVEAVPGSATSQASTSREVYKSLFTSSKEYQNRQKENSSHWVTYNPYHL